MHGIRVRAGPNRLTVAIDSQAMHCCTPSRGPYRLAELALYCRQCPPVDAVQRQDISQQVLEVTKQRAGLQRTLMLPLQINHVCRWGGGLMGGTGKQAGRQPGRWEFKARGLVPPSGCT